MSLIIDTVSTSCDASLLWVHLIGQRNRKSGEIQDGCCVSYALFKLLKLKKCNMLIEGALRLPVYFQEVAISHKLKCSSMFNGTYQFRFSKTSNTIQYGTVCKRPEFLEWTRFSAIYKIMHCYLGLILGHPLSTCDCLGFYTWIHASVNILFASVASFFTHYTVPV